MALMLRLLGVPARVAVGFTSGEYSSDNKEWVVKDTNAHAWVEVVPRVRVDPFDPTPGRGELDATYAVFSPSSTPATPPGSASPTASRTSRRRVRSRSGRPPIARPRGRRPRRRDEGTLTVVRERGLGIFTLLALVIGGGIAAVLVLKAIRRSARFATRDPRELASACRRDIVAFLADQGVDLSQGATMQEIGAILQRFSIDATPFVRDVTVARFGPPARNEEALRRARRDLRVVRKSLRARLGWRAAPAAPSASARSRSEPRDARQALPVAVW